MHLGRLTETGSHRPGNGVANLRLPPLRSARSKHSGRIM